MDEMHKKDTFQEYSRRLDRAKEEVKATLHKKTTSDKLDNMMIRLEDDKDNNTYLLIFALLMILITASLIIAYINFGNSFKWIIILVLLMGYLIYYRSSLKSAQEKNQVFKEFEKEENQQQRFFHKTRFLSTSIDVKKSRISLTRLFYILFFPIFLYLLREIYSGPLEPMQITYSLMFGFFFGGIFWHFFFREEIQELSLSAMELADIENEFAASSE